VQIIKLTEPLQTLLIDSSLRQLWGIPQLKMKLSVVWFVLGGAAICVGRRRLSRPADFGGVMVVVFSGCFLSTRNVLKKMMHGDTHSRFAYNNAPPNVTSSLQEGLFDFIHMSAGGFILLVPLVMATAIWCFVSGTDSSGLGRIMGHIASSPLMILSHPIYNLASLLVLSFVSAPTHSLLNSTKRIVCTLTVALWFGEHISWEMFLGLFFIMISLIPTLTIKDRCISAAIAIGLYLFLQSILIGRSLHFADKDQTVFIERPYSYFDDNKAPMSNCTVRFKDTSMNLCHFIPYGGNFGDEIGPAVIMKIVENKYGCSRQDIPVFNLAGENPRGKNVSCLFSLGSIFHMVRNGDHVWGTGMNANPKRLQALDKLKNVSFYSVRGPKTEALVQEKTHVNTSIAHGDPGFLVPFLFAQYRNRQEGRRKGDSPRFCFVPHFHDRDYKDIKIYPDVYVIHVKNSWQAVSDQLMGCDYVASTSLHGVIVADSMGIPTCWFQFEDTDTIKTEGGFKYQDYFEAIDQRGQVPVQNFHQILNVSIYKSEIELNRRVDIAKRTIMSFPYHLFTTERNARNLVIMIGTLRGGELAWTSFYKNVLEPNAAELALLVPEGIPCKSSSLCDRATYIWTHKEYSDWGDAIDEYISNDGRWRQFAEKRSFGNMLLGGVRVMNPGGSGAIILMLRVFLLKIFENEPAILDNYDRFVLTRTDHYYSCLHNLEMLDKQFLWVPSGEDYGGITDRHVVMNRSHILKALDILSPLVREPERYIGVYKNPEQLIKKRWEEEGLWPIVRRFDRMMFTCAVDGDTTRWKNHSKRKVPEGVYLKYFQEYNLSKFTCEGTYVRHSVKIK
jgi:hypothetical protein